MIGVLVFAAADTGPACDAHTVETNAHDVHGRVLTLPQERVQQVADGSQDICP